MRELIETIRCANLFPVLLIESTKDAHLGASLKIFPIVRGERWDGMNIASSSMVDMDGLDRLTRHSQNGNARRGRQVSKCSVKDEGRVYMRILRTRRRTIIVFIRTVILEIRFRIGRDISLPSETAKSAVLVATLGGGAIAKGLGTCGFSFDDVVSRSLALHQTMPFIAAAETPTLIDLGRSVSTTDTRSSCRQIM